MISHSRRHRAFVVKKLYFVFSQHHRAFAVKKFTTLCVRDEHPHAHFSFSPNTRTHIFSLTCFFCTRALGTQNDISFPAPSHLCGKELYFVFSQRHRAFAVKKFTTLCVRDEHPHAHFSFSPNTRTHIFSLTCFFCTRALGTQNDISFLAPSRLCGENLRRSGSIGYLRFN
jgi:hypothetical protein